MKRLCFTSQASHKTLSSQTLHSQSIGGFDLLAKNAVTIHFHPFLYINKTRTLLLMETEKLLILSTASLTALGTPLTRWTTMAALTASVGAAIQKMPKLMVGKPEKAQPISRHTKEPHSVRSAGRATEASSEEAGGGIFIFGGGGVGVGVGTASSGVGGCISTAIFFANCS